jgi:hypothetical protein
MYVRESWAQRTIPVLTYYMALQSGSSSGCEAQTDGGYFWSRARAYYVRGTVRLP